MGPSDEPEVVFGDSTPFPHGVEFIATTRAAIGCIVQLLQAQVAIDAAMDAAAKVHAATRKDEDRLDALLSAIGTTTTAFRASSSQMTVATASRALEAVAAVVESQRRLLQDQARMKLLSSEAEADKARALGRQALAAFLLTHDLPGTQLGLYLQSSERAYVAQAAVATPFGVDAVFSLAIAEGSAWAQPRRAGQLLSGACVHIADSGVGMAKRGKMRKQRLDGLYLTELTVAAGATRFQLRKRPTGGAGVQLEIIEGEEEHVRVQLLDEEGRPMGEADELGGEDRMQVVALAERAVDEACELTISRSGVLQAGFGARPLEDLRDPRAVAQRMIAVLAPVVRQISARSGAPGELVLRRAVGGGRREEVYVTKAELLALSARLPAQARALLDPLGLGEGPRAMRSSSDSVSGEIR